MHRVLDRVTLHATVYLLVAGGVLIAASAVGLGGSAALVALLLAATVVFFAVREFVPLPPNAFGRGIRSAFEDVWIATALAATATAVTLDATPGELQALGGLLGLIAMVNYFLRPIYYGCYVVVSSLGDEKRPKNS